MQHPAIDLLKRNDYYISLQLQEGGCIFKYPHRVMYPQSPSGKIDIKFFMDGPSVNGGPPLPIPQYAWKAFVYRQLCTVCQSLSLTPQLVIFYNQDDFEISEDDFFSSILNTPDELHDKEMLLCQAIVSHYYPDLFANIECTEEQLEAFNALNEYQLLTQEDEPNE